MHKVLCFGDSNTWGYSPTTGQRMPADSRWPRVMASLLGEAYQIIEAGQPGRTTYPNSPDFGLSSGIEALLQDISKHQPDCLVLMLGTNDLYPAFHLSAEQISDNLERMVVELDQHCVNQRMLSPKILLLAPPAIDETGRFGQHFAGAKDKSTQLAEHYQTIAHSLGCGYLDVSQIITGKLLDGVHMNSVQHQALGEALANTFIELP
ncbi:GDSL-type esterase/lipase family protein [Agarivorans sp. DSG3-1]|uniref:GDSL-type esterase/lipase family protein n=1 Tax=Agarivorans sp. DSG3-1 TaxID=3342249 RepID=UPI00398E4093